MGAGESNTQPLYECGVLRVYRDVTATTTLVQSRFSAHVLSRSPAENPCFWVAAILERMSLTLTDVAEVSRVNCTCCLRKGRGEKDHPTAKSDPPGASDR